jgi:hypothetical protein
MQLALLYGQKQIKRRTLIKLIFGESNKITLGPNQNQIKTTLFLLFHNHELLWMQLALLYG